MKTKYALLTIMIVLFSLNNTVKAQLALPYYTGFDTPTEQAGWLLYELGVSAAYGPWTVSNWDNFSPPNCLYHDYNNTDTVEDWYVSPALNFTASSKITIKIKAFSPMGAPAPIDYIGIWFSSGNQDPSLGQYTEVANLTSLTSSNNSQWIDTTINLPLTTGTGYIGFKYINVDDWFTVKVDNINVTTTTSIFENNNKNNILIYPNPTTGKIVIDDKSSIESIEIYNLLGKNIYFNSKFNIAISNEIDLSNFPKGSYFIKLHDKESTHTEKIIIQ